MKLKTINLILWTAWMFIVGMTSGAVGWFFGATPAVIVFVVLALAPLGASANGANGKSCSGGDDCEYFQEDDHG